jgi:hypothetical protein
MSLRANRTSVADAIVERARTVADRLRTDPYFGRLMEGDVDRDEYAGWLVQMHKYIRHTVRALHGHADAMIARAHKNPAEVPIRASAQNHAREEDGHDDVLLADLSVLWNVSREEARGRVEHEVTAPSVVDWERLSDVMLARFPVGMIGIGLALETISTLVTDDMRRNLIARSGIARVEHAVEFLKEHSGEVEADHTAGARVRADMLTGAIDRSSMFFYGNAALTMFEGLVQFLNEKFPAKTPSAQLAGAGS